MEENCTKSRTRRILCEMSSILALTLLCIINGASTQMNAYRVEDPNFIVKITSDGIVHIEAGRKTVLRLFSPEPLSENTQISFTNIPAPVGTDCNDLRITEILNVDSVHENSALVTVRLHEDHCCLMFCLRQKDYFNQTSSPWIHQGNGSLLQIGVIPDPNVSELLPVWAKCILIIVFLCISGVFSGLTLTLLSFTKTELKFLRTYGTSRERLYAKTATPLRKRGNYLLCTLLLVNTLANVVVTTLLYEMIKLYALIAATFGILFIGELIPQSICTWFGLLIGTKTVWFTNIFLILTFPVSYPVSKLMDLFLANEIPSVYNRDRLHELVKSCNTENEVKLGKAVTTLDLSTKCVRDIMTKLEDVFMVEYNSMLTSDILNQILKTGFTRVPVYEIDRTNIVALLHVKDLALLDDDCKISLKMLCKFYNHPVNFVFEDTKLNVMLEEFKKGQSHMAFVQRVNSEGAGDPFYETLGMITLQDVIEDIFQSEIIDESAIILENKDLITNLKKLSVGAIPVISHEKNTKISPKLLQAARSYLSSSVAPFHPQWMSKKVLEHLIDQSAIMNLQLSDPCTNVSIYEIGKISDSFILLLDGHVQIDIGNEHFTFTEGPFSVFGLQILKDALEIFTRSITLDSISEKVTLQQSQYIPDFTLRAITNVQYLQISKAMYFAALRATLLQRQQHSAYGNEDMSSELNDLTCSMPCETVQEPVEAFVNSRSLETNTSNRIRLLT